MDTALPAREEFVTNALRLPGQSRADFARTLGDPDSVAAEVVPNRHVPGVTDTLFTLYYPDLTAHIHRPGPGGELTSSVEVRSDRHLRYPAIGVTASTVESAFGPPDLRTDSSLTYRCTTCVAGDDPVEFLVRNGRVQRLRFNYYVD